MDEVLLSKAESIERCVRRVREDYVGHEDEFEVNFTRQDAILLNLQRACEACIDMANRMIRLRRLGYPKESKDSFEILSRAMVLDRSNSLTMQAMVGFRNIAVHQYQATRPCQGPADHRASTGRSARIQQGDAGRRSYAVTGLNL